MLHKLVGLNLSESNKYIFSSITRDVSDGKKVFLIVPEQSSVDFEIELCRTLTNRANYKVEVQNFTRLPKRIFKDIGGIAGGYLDRSGKALMLCRAIDSVLPLLTEYASSADCRGFSDKMLLTIEELRDNGITSDDLLSFSGKMRLSNSVLSDKLHDYAIIIECYEKLLAESGNNPKEPIERLGEALESYDAFSECNIYISGFYEFTAPQYRVIEAMMKQADHVYVTIPMRPSITEETKWASPRAYGCMKRLDKMALKSNIESENICYDIGCQNSELDYLSAHLLDENECYGESSSCIELSKCVSPTDEVTSAARKIRKLIADGVKYSDIAVLYRNEVDYADIIEAVFEKYEIPLYINEQKSLISYPLTRAITAAVHIAEGDTRLRTFWDYLKSGYSNAPHDEELALENYLLTWGLQGSRLYSPEPYCYNPDGFSEKMNTAQLEKVNTAKEKIIAPLLTLKKSFENGLIADKIASIVRFLDSTSVYESVTAEAESLRGNGNYSDANECIQIWNCCISALEQLSVTMGESEDKGRLPDYLSIAVSGESFAKKPAVQDSVNVGNISLIRPGECDSIFLLGLTDGVFPQPLSSSTLLTISEKDELYASGLELCSPSSEGIIDEFFLFANSLTGVKNHLFCSYYAIGYDGNTRDPSVILNKIITLFPDIEIVDSHKDNSLICSPEEAYEYIITNNDGLSAALKELIGKRISYLGESYSDRLHRVLGAALFHSEPRKLTAISGNSGDSTLSISRFSAYENCRFSYFVKYMLRASPPTRAEFNSPNIGNFVHSVLESYMRYMHDNGISFADMTQKRSDIEIERITADCVKSYISGVQSDDARIKYLIKRITESTKLVVESLNAEFTNSGFVPAAFEYDIKNSGYSLPLGDGSNLKLNGKIDRIDTYCAPDGTIYARVVDYKTGDKEFKFGDVLQGHNNQMLLYLSAIWAAGLKSDGQTHCIEPAGIMYMNAFKSKAPMPIGTSEEELKKKAMKSISRNGIFLDNNGVISAMASCFLDMASTLRGHSYSAEVFRTLRSFVESDYITAARLIKKGKIETNPYRSRNIRGKDSCQYCECFPVCRYEAECTRKYRENIKNDAALAEITEKAEKGGDKNG